ncbi:MAG: GDP-mannose 4,6-dehydratase [Nanoarchaeota archaeon]
MEDYDEKFKDKSILITGGLGFIGSNLAKKLVDLKPKKIIIVDSLVKNLGGNLENITGISPSIDVYKEDISNAETMAHILKDNNVDYIFNLAGSVSHINSKNNPLNDLDFNLRAHVSLLENCREYAQNKKGKKLKVLFSSTRDTYGKVRLEDLPIKEGTFVWREADPQGIHKHATEFHHRWYGSNFGFDTVSLRLTNTYGPRQRIEDPNLGFLGYFIHQALKNETIDLWGGGESLRDFNYVDDVVEAMLMTMTSGKTNGGIYNLGSYRRKNGKFEDVGNNTRTVGESAKIITRLAGTGECKEIPYPEERKAIEPGHVYLDATKIFEDIGWEPKISFEEGIRRTIDFYRNHKNYRK